MGRSVARGGRDSAFNPASIHFRIKAETVVSFLAAWILTFRFKAESRSIVKRTVDIHRLRCCWNSHSHITLLTRGGGDHHLR